MRYDFQTIFEEQFVYIIDNQKYLFKGVLNNPEGDLLTITKASILSLELTDSLFDPWVFGSIIIDNTESAIERYVSDPSFEEFNQNSVKTKGYTVRGDARDFLTIEIIPLDHDYEKYNYMTNSESFNNVFGLRYVFCLEDYEPIRYNEKDAIRYRIADYDLEILKERKSFFNSVDVLPGDTENISQLSNADRAAPTGDCLKRIITNSLNEPNSIYTTVDGVSGTLTPDFESGTSRIFYSSSADSNSYEDIMYLLKHHVSNTSYNDFSFLKKQNGSGEYTLQSAGKMFSQAYNKSKGVAGIRLFENFTITGGESEDDPVIQGDRKKPDNVLEFGEKSEIIDYKFFNTEGSSYKDKVKTRIVHSYNFKDKLFNIDILENNVQTAREKFSENYVTNLKGKDNDPSPNFPLTQMQVSNLSFDNVFSLYGEDSEVRKSVGINRLLKNALVLNMGVEIVVKGQVHRKSGNFFSIDRLGSYVDNDYDNKLLGIYYIAEVKHEFVNDNEYYNRLIGIKTYHYTDPKYREDIL